MMARLKPWKCCSCGGERGIDWDRLVGDQIEEGPPQGAVQYECLFLEYVHYVSVYIVCVVASDTYVS